MMQCLIMVWYYKTLVTDIDPDQQVKESMNRINASEREKMAAQFEGDAQRILIVERAKAEAESKRLQGQGIADQRREIARGLEDSVKVLNNVDINSQEASALIVVTQHYDTLQSIGEETNSNLILLPNSPQAGSDMLNNMVASFTASNQIGEAMKKAKSEFSKFKMMSPTSAVGFGSSLISWVFNWRSMEKRGKVKSDIKAALETLNDDHYGLEEVKDRILEYLAVQKEWKILKPQFYAL